MIFSTDCCSVWDDNQGDGGRERLLQEGVRSPEGCQEVLILCSSHSYQSMSQIEYLCVFLLPFSYKQMATRCKYPYLIPTLSKLIIKIKYTCSYLFVQYLYKAKCRKSTCGKSKFSSIKFQYSLYMYWIPLQSFTSDDPELSKVIRERDDLKALLDKFERHMAEVG